MTPAYSSRPLAWTILADGSLRSGQYHIVQARVGITWELWRIVPGYAQVALGTGSQAELSQLAARFAGGEYEQEDYSHLVASLQNRVVKRKRSLTGRAWSYLTS